MTLVYPPGDFEAFLTAILETWVNRAPEWSIEPASGDWFGPGGPWKLVSGNPAAASRILGGVEGHAGVGARRVLCEAFRHAEPGKEPVLAEFIRACVRYRRRTLDHETDHEVKESLRRSRAVRAEAHRFLELARFQSVAGQGWYARFEPDHDVLGMLVAPFQRRMEGVDWMLHDVKREAAWVVQAGEGRFVTGIQTNGSLRLETAEGAIQDLWRRYFATIAIPGRINPKLQRSKMPLKTWKNLVERPGTAPRV